MSLPPSAASSLNSAAVSVGMSIKASVKRGTKLVAESRLIEEPPCGIDLVLADQNTARENADRAFQHAHILIHHHMLDARAVEQRFERRDQDRIVGANELTHDFGSAAVPRRARAAPNKR